MNGSPVLKLLTNRIMWIKSYTRKNLYHLVNLDKNVCSCEDYQYEGTNKNIKDYKCKHLIDLRSMLHLGEDTIKN